VGAFRSSTYVDFRQKLTWRLAQSLLRRFEVLHLLPEPADLVADPTRIRLGNIGFSPICRLHRAKISRDALIDLLQARLDLRARKVAIASDETSHSRPPTLNVKKATRSCGSAPRHLVISSQGATSFSDHTLWCESCDAYTS
jgi:hypothetical protein